jgi:hypothetical protein
MKHKLTLTLLLALVVASAIAGVGGHKRKVLIIGIDGCRSDALQQANTPNIDSLVTKGFFTYDSWHCDITISGPSWSSIMCGVYHEKHGVTNNNYTGSHYNQYPYFPTRAKEIDSTFKCVQYTEWAPMSNSVYNDGWDTKIIGTDGYTQGTGAAASIQIQDPNVDVLFTYFDKVDLTGHSSGFSPGNPAYIQAIDSIDVQIGNILAAMRARPTYAQEDWLVLLTTDHGGTGTGHGGLSFEERHIWWIGYSDRCIHRQVPAGPDPSYYALYPITQTDTAKQRQAPVQADIAVTALHHLIYDSGIRPENQAAWALDGRSWLCEMGLCDNTTGIETLKEEMAVKIASNPSKDGHFTVWCENEDNKAVQFTVIDATGKVVKQLSDATATLKHHINLSDIAKGNYYLTIQSGSKSATRSIVIE